MRGSVDSYRTDEGRRWRIRYDLPPDPETGERRQTTRRGFTSRDEAEAALAKAVVHLSEGTYVHPSKATLAEYLRQWLDGLRKKPTTLANYRGSVERYLIPELGGVKLTQLTAEHLDGLYRRLEREGGRNGQGLSPKTVRHVHTAIRKALQDAAERGHIGRNVADLSNPPTQKQARSRRARDKCWTAGQLRTFLAHTEDDRLYGLWYLLATTGLRRAEVLGLRWNEDVDLNAGTIRVGAQTITAADGETVVNVDGKTDAAERTIALDDGTADVLRSHRTRQLEERMQAGPAWNDSGLMFTMEDGRTIRPDYVSHVFLDVCRDLDLPEIGPHGLRHTYATVALRAGVQPEVVSQRLGHADVSITLSIYSHVTDADDRRAAETAAAAIFGR